MEKRITRVNISSAGGTAAKNARTCKVTLPNSWIDAMGISADSRELDIVFDGNQIVISRHLAAEEFAAHKFELGHDVRRFKFYDGDRLCSTITADFTDKTLASVNHVDDPVVTAFGVNVRPTWEDYQEFLEERCVPRGRAGLREYLEAIGVGGYDPLEIIQKTAGRMAEDNQWLEMESLSIRKEKPLK